MYGHSQLCSAKVSCPHESIYEDDETATHICLDCAVVVVEQTLSPYSVSPRSHHVTSVDCPASNMIKDLLHKWQHVEGKMCDIIYDRYLKEKDKIADQKKHTRLLCYITYNELSKAGYGCLPKDVAELFGMSTSELFHFQDIVNDTSSPQISAIASEYGSLLDLSFKDKERISFICNTLKDVYNTNLKTLSILVTWYYCNLKYPGKYNLKRVCGTCNINYDNIQKVIKKPGWKRLEMEVQQALV